MEKIKSQQNLALILACIGVVIFALSLPATRYLTASLSFMDIGLSRSIIAAIFGGLALLIMRQPLPNLRQCLLILWTSSGITFGFPILTALGMETVPASHGAVILGGLSLATAAGSTLFAHERPSIGFWLTSLAGLIIIIAFAITQHGGLELALYWGDLALLGAVLVAGFCYALGGHLAKELGGWQVICWTMLLASPLTLLWAGFALDGQAFMQMDATGWIVLLFLSVMCSLVGFFFWFGAMRIGGIARIAQIQYAQPFLTALFSIWLLNEAFDVVTILFMVAIVAVIALSRKMAVR